MSPDFADAPPGRRGGSRRASVVAIAFVALINHVVLPKLTREDAEKFRAAS